MWWWEVWKLFLFSDGRTDRAAFRGGSKTTENFLLNIDRSFVLIMFTNSLRDFECVLSRCSNLIGVSTVNCCTSLLYRRRPLRDRIYFRSERNLKFWVRKLKFNYLKILDDKSTQWYSCHWLLTEYHILKKSTLRSTSFLDMCVDSNFISLSG